MGKNKHVDLFKDMIPAVDMGMKDLWDAVEEEGRKEIKGDFWNLNRYISNVKSNNRELQEHFVLKLHIQGSCKIRSVNSVYCFHFIII
jgi:hypothetical protein